MVVSRVTSGGLVVYAAEVGPDGRVWAWTAERGRAARLGPADAAAVLAWYRARPDCGLALSGAL